MKLSHALLETLTQDDIAQFQTLYPNLNQVHNDDLLMFCMFCSSSTQIGKKVREAVNAKQTFCEAARSTFLQQIEQAQAALSSEATSLSFISDPQHTLLIKCLYVIRGDHHGLARFYDLLRSSEMLALPAPASKVASKYWFTSPGVLAAALGSLDCLNTLKNYEPDMLVVPAGGRVPLGTAAALGSLAVVEWLLNQPGIVITDKTQCNMTALHHAAAGGHQVLVEFLLRQSGVSIVDKDSEGKTALHHAAAGGHQVLVAFLLRQSGVSINDIDSEGRTALHHAAIGGHQGVVEFLGRQPGVSINGKDSEGKTALHHAAAGGHQVLVEFLLQQPGVSIDDKVGSGRTALHFAAIGGHHGVVEFLVRQPGVCINGKDGRGRTALHYAAMWGHQSVVEFLVRQPGVSINDKNREGEAPLHLAAARGYLDVVEFLVRQHGGSINDKNSEGMTALHHAAGGGYQVLVAFLLRQSGVSINDKDSNGMTALHHAAINGNDDVVELLLQQPGIIIDGKDNNDKTALQLAVDEGNEYTVKLLMDGLLAEGASLDVIEAYCEYARGTTTFDDDIDESDYIPPHLNDTLDVYSLMRSEKFAEAKQILATTKGLYLNLRLTPEGSLHHMIAKHYASAPSLMDELLDLIRSNHRTNLYLPDDQQLMPYEVIHNATGSIPARFFYYESHCLLHQLLSPKICELIMSVTQSLGFLPQGDVRAILTNAVTQQQQEVMLTPGQQVALLRHEILTLLNTFSAQTTPVPTSLIKRLNDILSFDGHPTSTSLRSFKLSLTDTENLHTLIANLQTVLSVVMGEVNNQTFSFAPGAVSTEHVRVSADFLAQFSQPLAQSSSVGSTSFFAEAEQRVHKTKRNDMMPPSSAVYPEDADEEERVKRVKTENGGVKSA